MDTKNKLKYYNYLKSIGQLGLKFFLNSFSRSSVRQKVIFYNVVKKEITEEEQKELLNNLNLDLNTVEKFNEKHEDFRYILVGNIIDKHYYGQNKEIRSGTKHFRAGAKVYLFPKYGGNGHMRIPVYGLPRKSRRKILVVIRYDMIKNIRVKKTFDPKMIEKIDDSFFYDNFQNDKASLEWWFADSKNETKEITEDIDDKKD